MITQNILNLSYRKQAPIRHELGAVEFAKADKIVLCNNTQLYYITSSDINLIKLNIIFKDNSFWNIKEALSNVAVSKLIREGTENYSSKEINYTIEYYGAKLFTSVNSDFISIDLYVIKENFVKVLDVLKEIITKAVFPNSEILKFSNKSKNRLLANLQKNQYLANCEFKKLLFGENNKLGYCTKTEDFDNIEQESLIKYYKENFRPDNCIVIATGNINKTELQILKATFESLEFDSYNIAKSISTEVDKQVNSIQTKSHIQGVNKLQSTIIIGKTLPNKNHENYLKLQILNTILGGYFGCYLMSNLREDKGYTYGVHSMLTSNLKTGIFFINTEVGIENYKQAVEEIYKEIELLRTKYISDEVLSTVKNYMIGDFRSSIKNIFSYGNLLRSIIFYNLDYPGYYNKYFDTIKNITKEELKTLAKEYFTDGFYEVVVGI